MIWVQHGLLMGRYLLYGVGSLVSEQDPREIYKDQEKIGSGSVAEVYRATDPSGRIVALKKMKLTAQNTKLITSEIVIMQEAAHPNVVEYYDSYLLDQNILWVAMEFMPSGCVTDILDAWEEYKLDERHIARICLDVRDPNPSSKVHPLPLSLVIYHEWGADTTRIRTST